MQNKLKMESLDMTKTNIDKIAELFPQVVTEMADPSGAVDENGKPLLKKAIDFEKLKLVLSAGTGDYVVADDERERYEFTWVGKRQAMIDAATPIRKTLRPCPEESKDWASTENLYIEGDNLEVLKLLQESYLGKVKMIYIDPPYNTGKDFIYKDNFTQSREEYEEELELFDEEGNRLFQNTETNGRFHSDWCSMIYPRLQLARNLLTDDGVIFISIDDNELDNLTKISSEVFGVGNWLATLIWNKQHSQQQGVFKRYHESIIVFAKNANVINNIDGGDGIIEAGAQKKISKANPASEFVFPAGVRFDAPDGTIITGTYGDSEKSSIIKDRLYSVNGVTAEDVTISAGWTQKNQMLAYFNGETVYDTKGQLVTEFYFNSAGKIKCTKNRSKITPPTLLPLYGMVSEQTEALFKLMGGYFFDMPKPVNMLKDFASWFAADNDIILDFFSGSATTAHAVMQLNAEDGGNRKFIMVQLPEVCDENSEAAKAGYSTICEIGKERIRRAGAKIVAKQKAKDNGLFAEDARPLDTGFRVFKLDTTNMKDVYYAAGQLYQKDLLDTISNIKDDRSDIDLLYGCLLDWGVYGGLQMPHTTEQIDSFTVHTVDSPLTNEIDLIACFDSEVSETVVRTIAKRKPTRALFRDSSFADSANKINVFEIFKSISPDTTVKVI